MSQVVAAPSSFRTVVGPGLRAIARFWKPFVLIQSAALALLLSYFYSPAVKALCESLSAHYDRGGAWAAALASALAGGLLPEFAKLATGVEPAPLRRRIADITFNFFYFALNGTIVFYFYRFQGILFGTDASAATITKKILVDQYLFTPFFTTPLSLIAYACYRNRFSLPAIRAELTPATLIRRIPSLLIPCWAFWTPMVVMIYALPGTLQFLLFAFALGAWSLLMVFIANAKE